MSNKKIVLVGAGYVGMSIAVLLSIKNDVVVIDNDKDKVDKINNKTSTVKDDNIQNYLDNKKLNLTATINHFPAYKEADYVVIATPTNYDPQKNFFDTSIVEQVIEDVLSINRKALIIIKSTIPIGFTKKICMENKTNNIVFCPEFLREGHALADNLLPSRIIIGGEITHQAKIFADLMTESTSNKKSLETLFMGSSEAESIKLFSNAYLALRVAFFNELDNFSIHNNLNSKEIIRGVSLDKRIGNFYNNPSIGYGGYCLPKDTKQLLSNFKKIPQKIISAIVESNEIRKNYIVEDILSSKPRQIGCFRTIMKTNSDNFRDSSILDIIKKLRKNDVKIKIFEPLIEDDMYEDFIIEHDINRFKKDSDLIILNRMDSILDDVSHKIYSRDIFNLD